ncbi:MAG: ATP-binding protein [Candidatus Aminicenantes bacterium]|nr:MAG: ATP-binding protein [Candidatus Aminicenantes bacterium]
MIDRNDYLDLWQKLSADKSMVFMTGPRQAGKTTLSEQIQKRFKNSVYFNWDIIAHKRKIIQNPTSFQEINRVDDSTPLVIFDEIHKYKNWKNYLKGLYDEFAGEYQFLVTGSGRLDVFRKGGDSLAGRYFMFHLFPFTLSELTKKENKVIPKKSVDWLNGFGPINEKESGSTWEILFKVGGFPEPFVKGSDDFYNLWTQAYIHQVIREEVRNFSDVKNIDTIELLYSILPSKVGSPFSINSTAQNLQVSFDSVKSWLSLLEKVFLVFKVPPWTAKISRAILKEKKWYLYNYAEIPDKGIRFENMVAIELKRLIFYWNELGAGRFSLHYIRNKDKLEVDFLVTEKNEPLLLIEAKASQETPSRNLYYFQQVLDVPAVQLVNKEGIYKKIKNGSNYIYIVTAHRWLSAF